MEEVASSILASSTPAGSEHAWTPHALGGFIAGEGHFGVTTKQPPFRSGDPRLRFVFSIEVASRDRHVLDALRTSLGTGSIRRRDPRGEGWQATAILSVGSILAHRQSVIPFMDLHLGPGAKRSQFELWLAAMDAYEGLHPTRWGRGPSLCRIEGCDDPVRGRGLCRRHYHQETGY
jgi:hypothetical protein